MAKLEVIPAGNRFKLIAAGYAFFIKDDKILLVRRFQTGYQDGKYSLPAGHLEQGETMTECILREIEEEVGVQLKAENVQLAHVMHRKSNDERLDFFFVVKKWNGEPKNCEPEKCDELAWFPLEALPQTTIPYIQAAIEAYIAGQTYSEFGWKL